MKVIFVNPPVIRAKESSAENNFKVRGLIFRPGFRNNRILYKIWDILRDKTARYGVRAGSRWPWTMDMPFSALHYPFIMGYTASYLMANGFEVNILDAIGEEDYFYMKFLEKVRMEKADIVVIEPSVPTMDIDIWFARKVSEFTDVCFAGPHIMNQGDKMLQEYPFIKYFLEGEYILSALEMTASQKAGVYQNKVVTDMDSTPFPFREYDSSTKYFDPTMPTPKPQLQIYGSKGCPFKCSFCLWPQTMYKGKVSLRQPAKIAQEIREAVHSKGFKSIFFDDDTFNIDNNRISKLCDELKGIGLPWSMMGRVDCSPDWLFDKMVDSGCVGMRFGIESFNIEILKRINKGIERVDFRSTLEYLSNRYPTLMLHLTMMKEMPGQSDAIHHEDLRILKDIGFDNKDIYRTYQISNCAPFPGTKMFLDLVKKYGEKAMENYSQYDGGQDTIMKELNK